MSDPFWKMAVTSPSAIRLSNGTVAAFAPLGSGLAQRPAPRAASPQRIGDRPRGSTWGRAPCARPGYFFCLIARTPEDRPRPMRIRCFSTCRRRSASLTASSLDRAIRQHRQEGRAEHSCCGGSPRSGERLNRPSRQEASFLPPACRGQRRKLAPKAEGAREARNGASRLGGWRSRAQVTGGQVAGENAVAANGRTPKGRGGRDHVRLSTFHSGCGPGRPRGGRQYLRETVSRMAC